MKKAPAIHNVSKADYAKYANNYGATRTGPRCKACGAQTWFRSASREASSAFVCHAENCKAEIRGM